MSASIKKNVIHRVLEVLSSGDAYSYTEEAILIQMNRRKKWWQFRPSYSIPQVSYSCSILYNDLGKDVFTYAIDQHGTVWIIRGNTGITTIRGCYQLEEYKESLKWWVWPARIGGGLVGLATIIGVVDSLKSPALYEKTTQQESRIKSLQERIEEDSIVLGLLRDSIKLLKTQRTDSSSRPSKP